MSSSFNLEKTIQAWKRKFRKSPAFEDGDIAELESHLRDRIQELKNAGISDESAFIKASAEIGAPDKIGDELYKTKAVKQDATPPWKASRFSTILLPNYLKTAFRFIKKSPVYSAVNIAGLATGIACCILILVYVQYQFSFDSFHHESEQIYRLNKVVTPRTGGTELHAISSGLMGPQLELDFPEIKEIVRIRPWFSEVLLSRDDQHLNGVSFTFADSTFFTFFDFKLLEGNPDEVLSAPMSMVISEEVARHFFKNKNAIGQTLKGLNGLDYTITGIAENAPDNSHLDYDVLVSWSSTGPAGLDFGWLNNWLTQAIFTYVRLEEGARPESLEAKFAGFMENHFPERADQYALYLQPFNKIYLKSQAIQYDDELKSGNISTTYIFSIVAFLILLIACINFVNLNTARSIERGQEIGVRKVLGALREQIGIQYLAESVMLSFLAMIVALFLMQLGKPVLGYIGIPESELAFISQPFLLLMLFTITLFTGLISGIYPAIVLSGFKPVSILKKDTNSAKTGGGLLRQSLVTIQFALSVILIAGTIVVYQQMNFLSDKDLGFEKEQVMVLPIGRTAISEQAEAFRNELLQYSGIENVTISSNVPGQGTSSFGINPEGKENDESWTANLIRVSDDDFFDTYGMELNSGRFFSEEYALDDSNAVVINEALASSLGWEDPVGKRLDIPGEIAPGAQVIGVVKDFHITSLYNKVDPLMLIWNPRYSYMSVKINTSNISTVVESIGESWSRFDPSYPFEYSFVDQTFAAFYDSEQRMLSILALFSGLAIFVACCGLFGLSTFMAARRKKEIGIRKVLGASVREIILLISKDFMKLVGLGFIAAVPLTWWLAVNWLQDFAYHINPGPGIFVAAGTIAVFLAILAILWQSLRAALTNPVNSLKSE